MSEGFAVSILVAFFVMLVGMPFMIEAFSGLIDIGFGDVEMILAEAPGEPRRIPR